MGKRVPIYAGALALWAGAVGLGFLAMVRYSVTPGRAAAAGPAWPGGSAADGAVERVAGEATIVMVVHPGCPCSKASIAVLGEIMRRHPGAAACSVLFEPSSAMSPDACRESALWHAAGEIPGVHEVVDEAHVGTKVLGAKTSGQVLAYDGQGRLRFKGGVTASRDHDGASDGEASLDALLSGGEVQNEETPVYGCALPLEGNS